MCVYLSTSRLSAVLLRWGVRVMNTGILNDVAVYMIPSQFQKVKGRDLLILHSYLPILQGRRSSTSYTAQIFQPDALPHAPPPESQLGLVEFQPVFELGLVPGPRPPHWSLPPPHVLVCPPVGLVYGLFGPVVAGAPHAGPGGCIPI